MNGKSDETLSKKAKNGRAAASNQFSARFVRSDSQSRCGRERLLGNCRDREPACKPTSLGRQR
jgi:hypothetical protein